LSNYSGQHNYYNRCRSFLPLNILTSVLLIGDDNNTKLFLNIIQYLLKTRIKYINVEKILNLTVLLIEILKCINIIVGIML